MVSLSWLIQKIREKPELRGVAEKVAERAVSDSAKGLDISKLSEKDAKIIIQEARKRLRDQTGQFRTSKSVTDDSLRHFSIRQREKFYPKLKSIISKLSVKSILDLGCGINPIFMAEQGMRYYAYDIREDDLALIQKHFNDKKISGETKVYDLMNDSDPFPQTDLCVIMNVLDGVDKRGHKKATEIMSRINSPIIFVSFPLVKLSGKKMDHPERPWFRKILEHQDYKYMSMKTETEVWYFISREERVLQSIQEMQ